MNRWWILGPALLASAALVLFGEPPAGDGSVVQAEARPRLPGAPASIVAAVAAPAPRSAPLPRALLYPERRGNVASADLFAQRSWIDAPAVAAGASAPGREVPPFPFAVVGRKREGDRWEVYLTREEYAYVVKEGDVIESDYRVDRITGSTVTVTYLPLQHEYVVELGATEL
ncbi:hypothetical protein [Methylibium rhizosphaerae]|uniref:hypothetical protein n=1 Tax=Methylibium rhizosphaerae TaxID=2570323 RepID=UPI00112E44DF|nr:hypothetical protein [Methylibium rhizosphaerae]